ncbi:MAG TPA: hypothetical protein VFH95_06625 [Candidatus Kapabacteria bacterium]|nr:hypothetical protein [Candidatus Kapabacteria bacterium]
MNIRSPVVLFTLGLSVAEVVWNAGAAAQGMYLYRITTGDGVDSHTILREGITR